MPEPEERCSQCHKHCLLSAPGCSRGEQYSRGQGSPGDRSESRREHGDHGGSHHGPNRHGGDSLADLLAGCGRRLHHGEDPEKLFSVLTLEERKTLQAILIKMQSS